MTKRNYNVTVCSNANNPKAKISDSIYCLPAKIKLSRSKDDLGVTLISDSLIKNYTIKSSPNPAFLYGNLIWLEFSPVAYLVDFTSQKRFYYGKSIYLDYNDTNKIIRPPVSKFYHNYASKSYTAAKGQINLVYSLPWVNSFYLQPQHESSKSNTGFWGISMGLEYYYKNNKFISFNANAVSDFFIPVPAAIDISGEYEMMSSVYSSLTDNIRFNRFTLGYGLNYSKNIWDLRYNDWCDPPPPTRSPVKRASRSVGVTLDGYHQVGKYFFIGLIYRPSILKVDPDIGLKYEHLISIDFAWKFRLKK